MELDQAPGQREAEAGAGPAPLPARVELLELLEDAFLVLLRDPDARVGDADQDVLSGPLPKANPAIGDVTFIVGFVVTAAVYWALSALGAPASTPESA